MKECNPAVPFNAAITLPGSKSITHRAIIAAALAEGKTIIKKALLCRDTLYTLGALESLGAKFKHEGDLIMVSGTGGRMNFSSSPLSMYLGNSGTSFRLLLSVLCLGNGKATADGSPRMRERPVDSLVSALRSLGGNISYIGKKGFPPLRINAHGLKGGYAKITGSGTSQGISSLLLSAPLSDRGITIEVTGEPVSKAYVDITCDVMKAFGIPVERDGYRIFSVVGATRYQACTFAVEGDASSASYFWAAAAVTGGKATTINLDPFSTRQGDAGFLEILKAMGADVQTENSSVTVTGGDLKGLELDMSSMPDLVPTLAAVAVFARGTTLIRNVAHLRIKESDRLASIAMEWKKLGASVEEFQDGLRIEGGRPLHGATLDPHDDHRLAMSLAVVSLRVPDIEILNRDCVEKSFPGFWGLWDAC